MKRPAPDRPASSISESLGEDPLHILHGVSAGDGGCAVIDDCIGVLQTVSGTNTDDALALVDDSNLTELLESGYGCRGCGLDANTLPPSEELLCCDDLVVGDGGAVSARGVDGLECLPS